MRVELVANGSEWKRRVYCVSAKLVPNQTRFSNFILVFSVEDCDSELRFYLSAAVCGEFGAVLVLHSHLQ